MFKQSESLWSVKSSRAGVASRQAVGRAGKHQNKKLERALAIALPVTSTALATCSTKKRL